MTHNVANYCEFPQDISLMHSGIRFGVKIDNYFQVACRCRTTALVIYFAYP